MENYTKYKLKGTDELVPLLSDLDNIFVIACKLQFRLVDVTESTARRRCITSVSVRTSVLTNAKHTIFAFSVMILANHSVLENFEIGCKLNDVK